MLNIKPARQLDESPGCVLVLAHEPRLLALISKQVVRVLGLSVMSCDSLERFQEILAGETAVILSIVDMAMEEPDLDQCINGLQQNQVPVITVFNRRDNCSRVSSKNVIASLDRDDKDQLATISSLAENIFNNRKTRIVVLHENRRHRDYLEALLNNHYFTVMQAEDVAEAMELLNLYPQTQLLLIDEKCRNIGGFNIIQSIRKNASLDHLAILGLTVQRDPQLISELFAAGANDVIPTSTDDAELLVRVNYHANTINTVRHLKRGVFRDNLTSAYTIEYFHDVGRKVFAGAARGGLQIGIAAINVDNFSGINERYGAAVGNYVLRSVADQLGKFTRDADFVARKEGDEFLCLISCVGRNSIRAVLERIRLEVEKTGVWYGNERIPVTLSIGGTTETGASLDMMQTRAEMALRQARKDGPNRVEIL